MSIGDKLLGLVMRWVILCIFHTFIFACTFALQLLLLTAFGVSSGFYHLINYRQCLERHRVYPCNRLSLIDLRAKVTEFNLILRRSRSLASRTRVSRIILRDTPTTSTSENRARQSSPDSKVNCKIPWEIHRSCCTPWLIVLSDVMLNSCKVVLLADKCLDKLHEVGYFPSNKYRKCLNRDYHCENDNDVEQQYD